MNGVDVILHVMAGENERAHVSLSEQLVRVGQTTRTTKGKDKRSEHCRRCGCFYSRALTSAVLLVGRAEQ